MVKTIKLRNGSEVEFDEKAPITLFEVIISEVLIPKYKAVSYTHLTLPTTPYV